MFRCEIGLNNREEYRFSWNVAKLIGRFGIRFRCKKLGFCNLIYIIVYFEVGSIVEQCRIVKFKDILRLGLA